VGALLVIALGYLAGLLDWTFTSDGNSQIASRINPKMIDLVAALATGLVGAFALVRKDVSDTLPGVAIAIALVPPLAVCGLVLQETNYNEAFGALVLFGTNVAAIIFTGTMAMLVFKVREAAVESGREVGDLSKRGIARVVGLVIVVAIPLGFGSFSIIQDARISYTATPIAQEWADQQNWVITKIGVENGVLMIVALGAPPDAVKPEELRAELDDAGLQAVDMKVALVTGGARDYPGDSDQ
nr:DUF389 domain-containing protein [Actinomycetes bacterium]